MKHCLNYSIHLKKGKRFRSAFTTEQVNRLEREFKLYPYISNSRRKDIAKDLNIPERAVKIWFQNRRMKEKKDTTNKDPNDKTTVISNAQLNNVPIVISTNDASLSLLTVSTNDPRANNELNKYVEQNKFETKEKENANFYKDVYSEADTFEVSKANDSTPEIRSNAVSTTTSGEYSIDLFKKYKSETNDSENVKMLDSETEHNSSQVKQHSPDSPTPYKYEAQCTSYHSVHVPAKTLPQGPRDLSSKPNILSATQENDAAKTKTSEVPLYFAQPYIPPGNMMWKPVNVAPIMSGPIPTVAIPNPSLGGQPHSTTNRSCSCDCHMKSHNPVLFHHNNPSPNLQYVITAVPYHNHTHKFHV
ncbi:homeobox protein SMOX-3-like [Pectinophora gossypiella]|uniref:homeobox protein SMOX-3-like n=1 Tax=Pectinophora gossypiella TaxID=13191 RepID=UPI00214E8979|nr:homeobox protein SMOX-3-like [Pectinophora gossypiella]XP_049870774.1 homeobox protein SMOX-3-like [Pectinophora gossypiella]